MANFGSIGYGVLGLLYLALCVLLLTSWRGRQLGGYFIGACIVSAAWAITLSFQISQSGVPDLSVFLLDAFRSASWILFLVMLLDQAGLRSKVRIAVYGLLATVISSGPVWWLLSDRFWPDSSLASIAIPGGLILALVGLILIEQLYRNTPADSRQKVQTLALGLGGMFAYDLFLYSQGMLFGMLDTAAWMARGAVNIIFVPIIAVAARRNPSWDLNIFVSRQVVFYTTSLVSVGLYLLLMSLGGYALVIYGGTWGELAQIVFFVGAIVVLVSLLFSNRIRGRIKVFLSKHFFHNKYDYREEWLRLISTLTGFDNSSTRQIVIRAMAQIVGSPGGLLWTLNDNGESYQVVAGIDFSEDQPDIPTDSSLVRFVEKDGWLIDLEEYGRNPDIYVDLELPDWLAGNERAWLVVPLLFRQQLIGLVLLAKPPVPPKLNYEDRDLLKTAGSHIAVHIAQDRSDGLLAEARQFDAYNRLTAFLMHDLNNLIAQQSLIIRNAEKHRRNPDFIDDAIQTIAGSVERVRRVMDQLKRREVDRVGKPTELRFIVSAAVDRCSGRLPSPELNTNGMDVLVNVDAEQFAMVLTHLVKNAQDATPPDGAVWIRVDCSDGSVDIEIEDTGCGMSADYVRDHLFKPFDSTKGSQGMGIGAYQAREFARKMGGDLKVRSVPGEGTTVTLTLPVGEQPST